ncbi:MAG: hypothetical protein ABI067_10865 [Leifsonia sp.]
MTDAAPTETLTAPNSEPSTAPNSEPSTAPGAPAAPTAARSRRIRWYWWPVAAGVLLLTVGGVLVSFGTVAAYQGLPKMLVSRYLTDLEHGRASDALKVAGIKTTGADVLLTDAAFAKATNRISSFTLGPTVVRGTSATVDATILRGGKQYKQSFALQRTGGLPGFALWKLGQIKTEVVGVVVSGPGGLTFSVAGQSPQGVPADTGIDLRAFPGTYSLKFQSPSDAFAVPDVNVASVAPGAAQKAATVTAQLSASGTDQARAAVNTWLDACVASAVADPHECPFLVVPIGGASASHVQWHLDYRPSLSVQQAWTTGGWPVDSADIGQVSATATLTRNSDGATGTGTTGEIPFPIHGTITFDGKGAVFTPSFGGQQAPQASS